MKRAPFLSTLLTLAMALTAPAQTPPQATATLHADQPGPTIHPELYGQFAEHLGTGIYGGLWVGPDSPIPNTRGLRNDVVAALRELHVPVIRWPGGCFADRYNWKDGIGPRDKRPKLINTMWGGAVEDNAFGTHEFFDLCDQINAQPYVAMNVGSGTVRDMMEWIDYITSDGKSPMADLRRANGRDKPWKLKYIGIGNESWGCGGDMRPEYYADEFRRYNAFALNFAGNKLFRIACGPNDDDTHWTDKVMASAGKKMNGIALHHYTLPTGNWQKKGSATDFDEAGWQIIMKRSAEMETLIQHHLAVMDKYDPQHKVGLLVDEWGAWYDATPGSTPGFLQQQNTLRDAMLAALTLNIFHQHADRIPAANIAQCINVLQAMIFTDGPKMVLTPTYHLFNMYKVHQGATVLPLDLHSPDYDFNGDNIPAISATASRDTKGLVHISLVNVDPNHAVPITITLTGLQATTVTGQLLTADKINSLNTFDYPDAVKPAPFTGVKLDGLTLTAEVPPKSVVTLELR